MIEVFRDNKKVVKKKWGEEVILYNNDYCGKLLRFKKGGKFSLHFHIIKNETWYINKGVFNLTYINTETAEKNNIILTIGDIINIERGLPHQLTAIEEGEIFECSTTHYDSDSYRVEKGDSQNVES